LLHGVGVVRAIRVILAVLFFTLALVLMFAPGPAASETRSILPLRAGNVSPVWSSAAGTGVSRKGDLMATWVITRIWADGQDSGATGGDRILPKRTPWFLAVLVALLIALGSMGMGSHAAAAQALVPPSIAPPSTVAIGKIKAENPKNVPPPSRASNG
jgi:preprotein translocase subunit SecG